MITFGRGDRVEQADVTADGHRHVDDLLDVGAALGLIAVQQRFFRAARERRADLQDQVLDVADAVTQSLPEERRGLVGGVAGQEDAPVPPLVGDERMESVDRRADDLDLVGPEPRLEQAKDGFRLLDVLWLTRPGAA